MFLSRLTLNPRNRQVRSELARPYEMHITLLKAFPQEGVNHPRSSNDALGVLFRVDQHPQTNLLTVIVQSQVEPKWFALAEQHDGRGEPYLLGQAETKSIELAFTSGQQLLFRLRANPTKRLSAGKGSQGKRVGLYDVAEQEAWLNRKATQHGFVIASALPSQQQRSDDSARQLKFLSVQFDGILQVTDPAAFLTAIQAGIGSGKAFGFGLLSVAPVR